jgi:Zn-dependent peptidase ImmA (M78 family)/DNA-binding XRE family transcriptional regulator
MSTINFRMVRLAREFQGLTQSALAVNAQIAQARLSRIEAGHVEPTSDEVAALAVGLDVPTQFLAASGVPAAVPLFRKRAIRSVRKLSRIQARLNTAVLIAQRLIEAGVEIDPPRMFPDPGEFDPADPDAAAQAIRRDWRLPAGPVDDVTAVIEGAGGIVLRADFGTDDASAAFISSRPDGRLWFLVNTREDAGDRVRLSLAHELGHAVLHRMLPAYDEAEGELQAFRFATAFLLPHESFDASIAFDALTLNDTRRLKRVYGVSIQAIVRAAFVRGLITRSRYTSLFKQVSARQWRTREPDPVALETPYIWPSILEVHRRDHGYDDNALARLAHVHPQTLNDLMPDYFSVPRLRLIPPTVRAA